MSSLDSRTPIPTPDLLPCPFCGSDDIYQYPKSTLTSVGKKLIAECQLCGAKAPKEVWNLRRAPSAESVAQGPAAPPAPPTEEELDRLANWAVEDGIAIDNALTAPPAPAAVQRTNIAKSPKCPTCGKNMAVRGDGSTSCPWCLPTPAPAPGLREVAEQIRNTCEYAIRRNPHMPTIGAVYTKELLDAALLATPPSPSKSSNNSEQVRPEVKKWVDDSLKEMGYPPVQENPPEARPERMREVGGLLDGIERYALRVQQGIFPESNIAGVLDLVGRVRAALRGEKKG